MSTDPARGLEPLIGNTPLLVIRCRFRGAERVIYAKSENLNMTGSVKDRMALQIIRRAYQSGALRPGGLIVEATSGNTGISFAAIGRALGHPVAIFIPSWMSAERLALLRSLGAELRLVTAEEGGFLGSIRLADQLAQATEGGFLPHQFSNEDNCLAHETGTGPELAAQLGSLGLHADAFVAGVGTGGTVMGVGRSLRRVHRATKVHPVEPASSPTLTTGHRVGKHRIQGISDEFIPPIVDLQYLDGILAVADGDAILMAQQLARLGLAVGISSGANFLAALLAQEQLGPGAVVATLFPDSNKKYLSTDLMAEEPVREGYLSPEVELLGFHAIGRVCAMCSHPVQAAQ
ncbi:MAG TPA: cysteine synthase family protein [Gemmatimonadales bacterium]|nr:cysteine synthase family protein [Gemmatimonadales bacterium]